MVNQAQRPLLCMAGARFDDRATGKISELCPTAKVVHLDIDPSEVSKLKAVHVALIGDVRESLGSMLSLVIPRKRKAWYRRIQAWKRQYPLTVPSALIPQKPYGLIRKIASMVDVDAFTTTDVGKHQMWTAQVYPFTFSRQLITSGGFGTMGFGVPAAIGVALAFPGQQVICFSGDGSLQMNLQELATAVEQKVNIKIIVLNNNGLGLVRQQQKLFYGMNHFACDFQIDLDFAAIAKSFGMQAYDLTESGDPERTLAVALSEAGPILINVGIGKMTSTQLYRLVRPIGQ